MYLLTFLLVILANFYGIEAATCPDGYQPIPLQDAKDAAIASEYVYISDLKVGNEIPKTGYRITKVYTALHTSTTIKVLIAKKEDTTMVAFRGTYSVTQFVKQFLSFVDTVGEDHNVMLRMQTFKMVEYFLTAYKEVFKGITELKHAKGKHVITGHSLGGALASLVSFHLKLAKSEIWNDTRSSLITFGQPRLGGHHFAEYHDQLISPTRKLRFVYKRDLVAHVPRMSDPFGENFLHHSREIWLATEDDMGVSTHSWWWHITHTAKLHLKVCKPLDPADCSNRYSIYSPFDHSISDYIQGLNSLSKPFYNKYGTAKDAWEEAFKSSC